eukprot:scaffold134087_cov34-Tisochrysis_lutea.AAC.2
MFRRNCATLVLGAARNPVSMNAQCCKLEHSWGAGRWRGRRRCERENAPGLCNPSAALGQRQRQHRWAYRMVKYERATLGRKMMRHSGSSPRERTTR